jgi:hypothetical protein
METLAELHDKNADIESVAEKATKNEGLLAALLDGLKSKAETYRYNCYKVLYSISQTHPEVLYPHWDHFAESLSSHNSYHKMAAVHLIANLTCVDTQNQFERIFEKYYDLLDDRSMVVAYYAAAASGRIAKAKPHLAKKITDKLLSIDKTHHEPGRKELIKTGVIEAFGEYFEESDDKDRIIKFVEQQLNSESPKTRKTAKEFLKKRNAS